MIKSKLDNLMWRNRTNIKELSEETGLSRTTISNLKNNYSNGISFKTLNALMTYFNCRVDEVIGFDDKEAD